MTLKVDGIRTNPIYLNNSYPVTNSFRGDYAQTDSVSLDTSQINTTNIAPLKKDTLNISASDKIKTQQKEKGMSTATKVGLAVVGGLATAYACVVGHRYLTKPSIEKVAQNFSEIFRRDISKDEAQKIVKRYEEILNIEKPEEFYKKAFEQIKKDYGYEKLNIPLIFKKTNGCAAAGWVTNKGELLIYSSKDKPISKYERKRALIDLIHEFQHAKQSEYQYRTSPTKTLKALEKSFARRYYANILGLSEEKIAKIAKSMNMSVKDFRKMIIEEGKKDKVEDIRSVGGKKMNYDIGEAGKRLQELFGHLTPFEKNSKEYELGLKYIENESKYIPSQIDNGLYRNQLLEVEAYGTESKFNEIYNYFANPWRIF